MKKQLSTAMAAAMAFGTVVPAFTNVANADTTITDNVNQVDLSQAFSFLTFDENGNLVSVDTDEVKKNGAAPVLTRAQVYNYNGYNANDRSKHTLKTEFAETGVVKIFEQHNPQDASNDLFVFARVDEAKLKAAQAQKDVMDSNVNKILADGGKVLTFSTSDFEVVKDSNGNYVYKNTLLNSIATNYSNVGINAQKDATIELARSLKAKGVELETIPQATTTSVSAQITALENQIKAEQSTLNAISSNSTAMDKNRAEIDRAIEAISTFEINKKEKDIIPQASASTVATLATAIESTASSVKTTIENFDITTTSTYAPQLEVVTKENTKSGLDITVTAGTATSGTLNLIDSLNNSDQYTKQVKDALNSVVSALQGKINEATTSVSTIKATIEGLKQQIKDLQASDVDQSEYKKRTESVLTSLNEVNNARAIDLKNNIINNISFNVTVENEIVKVKPLTIDTTGKIVIDENAMVNYASNITYREVYRLIQEELKAFFGTSIKTVAAQSMGWEQKATYSAKLSADNKSLIAGQTVKFAFDTTGKLYKVYEYKNEYKEYKETAVSALRKELFNDLMNIENGVNVYLDGKLNEDGTTEVKSNYFTLNFDSMTKRDKEGDDFLPEQRTVTAEEDRQVYHAANLLKYRLENRDDIIVETNEYGGKNQHQLTKVYVKNSDGTKGDLALTIDFLNTIEVKKNVSGQPSVVDMPNIEKTDFAKLEWAKDEIVNGMLACYIDATDTFRPKENITRAEFAKIICTVFGIETKDEAIKNLVNPFNDVKQGDWYYRYITALYNEGSNGEKGTIVNGYQDGTFKPKEEITRQEAAKMVAAAYDLKREALNITGENSVPNLKDGVVEKIVAVNGQTIHVDTLTKFADDKEIASWADESITALVKENAINGYEDGTFKPNDKINRVDALYMLVKTNKVYQADDSDVK